MGVSVDKAFKQALEGYDLTYDNEQKVQTFRDPVNEFMERFDTFKSKFAVKRVMAEEKFGLLPDFKLTKFFNNAGLIRGIIDLVVITGDHRAVIIDHKSGAMRPLDKYKNQIETYAMMVDALVPKLRSVRMAIHFLGGDPGPDGKRTLWSPEYSMDEVRTKFRDNLINMLQEAVESVKSKTPNKGCWKCQFCGFQPMCPAYQ